MPRHEERRVLAYSPQQLYDLVADPGETKNLAGSKPAELERLRKALNAFLRGD